LKKFTPLYTQGNKVSCAPETMFLSVQKAQNSVKNFESFGILL